MKGRNRITKMTAQRGLVLVIFFGSLLLSVDGQLGRSCDNPAVCSPPSSSCFNRPLPLSPPPSAVPYVCDCSAGTNIGFDCASDNIARDLITCYGNGCRTGSFQSENYPNKYPNRWSATYLLYIPGATRINFEFTGTGGFGLESFKDDLYVGAGLDFIETDLSENSTAVLDGTVRFFDNRTLNGQIYPPPFSLETDTVWLFFSSDKNLVFNGWQLSWTAVVDTTPPTIIQCPMDITRIIERGTATPLVITWDPEPFANDLNPPVTLVASHDSGDLFDISTTTVVYTFRDRFENAANCTFVVDIIAIDRVPPEVFGCPEDINREIELGSADPIIFWVEPFATDLGEVTTVRSHEPSTPFPVGITQVIYTFSDDASPPNTSPCRFLVTVTTVDTIPPDISNCPEEGVRELIELGTQGVVITWTEPSATDISGTARLIDSTRRSGDFFQPGTEVVTYTYSDASNNMATCTFIIVVIEVDTTPPLIIERVGNIEQIIERGVPGIEIIWQEPSSTDVSNTDVLLSRSIAPGFFFTADATTVIYTFTDETGNTATDSFCVTLIVVDTTPPDVFGCPMDITREIELGSEDPVIFWIEPFATDIGEVTTVSTHQPATSFQVGSTLVTYTFTDDATPPNSEFCEFMVTVSTVDTTPPAVTCPMNIFDTVELGISGLPITWVEPVFSDVSGTAFVSERSNFPGEFFLVGSTAVMYSISDASQNTAICAFTITILSVDTTPPSVTCPADITRVIELGESGINVEWDLPSGTDLSEPVTIVSTTRQPGSFFTVGQIEITYVLTDAASNQNSCNFMVTVTTMDTTPPSIIGCPGTQEATIEFGLQGIEVSWIEPTAFDISNVANLVSVSALPGSLFMVGDTNVTYVFADSSGNLATCSFIVTVLTEDTTPPEIPNCPNTIQETIELGSDDPIIVWVEPVATDLSGASVFSNSHTSGSTFQVGETVVTYLFSDPFGNMAVCSFSVVVNTVDTTPPVISNCPVNQDVVVELGDESGTAQWGEPTATDLSGVAILSTRTHIPGETFPVGQTVVMYIFTDPSMNSDLCQFVVIVRTVDSINPVCQDVPEGISVMLELGEQGVTVEWTPPTCFDLSGVTTLTPSHLSGSFFLIDTTTDVTFTCVDPAGLTGMCSFPVVIIPIDTIAPRIISCPSQESTIVTIELGEPGVMVTWQEPMVSDLSEVVLVSQSHMSNQFFVVGPTTVTYVYRDSSNNMANCQFVVSVQTVDTVAPIISLCPVEQTIQVELGVTSAVAFWVEPTATDVSGTATLLSRSIGPGESVPLGTTIVNYIFTDASSNTATCTFSITVSPVDTTPPVVVCTEDVPFEVELGTTGTIAVWTEPTATDISGVTSLTERSHSPGSFFSVGKTTVTYVFSDNTGNSATCIFCVCITTVDTTPPTCANVPQGVSGVVELGVTGTLVDWVELTCEDQSGTAFVTERTHVPSSFFEVGMTTVTYTCTDTSGNSQLCPFVVTVITEDTTDPTCVNLPTGVAELVELGVPGAIVNWQEPTCDDLSGTATVTMRSNAPFSFFSVGMTVVTYTCTDQAMNSGMCSFTVTVTAVDRTAPMCENVPMGPVGQVEVGMAAGTQVSWQEPTCNDISQTATVTDRTFPPGSFFTVGQTEVIYTCTDASGNSEMCVFSVTVFEVDTTPPECTNLPNDIRQIVELGTAGTEVSWIEPTCFDLSGTGRISMQSATSPFFFSVGMMLVTYTCTDASSNQNTCSFTVTIETIDTVAPIISLCPVEQTIQVELGVTSAVAFWVEPTATDFSGTATLLSRSIGPGESVPLGTTIVNYIFTDASSNTATCTFSITVSPVDTTPPVVVCTEDVPFEVELGTTGTIAVWTEPTATDISGVTSLTERSHSPGSFFSVGKTTVTYVFSDNTGNSATCIFCVCITTVDTTPPTCANVPQGVSGVVELGVTGTLVDWVELTCEDQSGTAFVTERTHVPSSFFEVGMTTVTYTCTDTSGNSQLCPFVVTVITEDTTDPTCVNLPTGVVELVELGVPGAIVNWQEPTCDDLSGTATVTMRSNAPFSFFSVGMTVVTYTCTDQAMNSGMCSFTVTVTAVDRTAPMCENVPMGPVGQVEVGMAAGTQVSWQEPTCNDISQTATVTDRTFPPGSFFTVGQTEVIYTCTDASGNSEMCVFSVTVFEVDTTPPECTNLPNDIRQIVELGTAGTEVSWIEPTCFDLSGTGRISMQSATSPFFFSVGMMLVTYTCTDASSNQNTCSFTVTIETIDTVAPIISLCPVEQTIQVELGVTSAVAFWVEPTATDFSGTSTLLSRSIGPGESVPLGTTIVNYIFTDASSNTATCTFSITVSPVDTTPPVVVCTEDVPFEVELGTTGTIAVWTEPTATDISGVTSLTERSHSPGSFFSVGKTTVTYVFSDNTGNSATCIFCVCITTVDTTPPTCANVPQGVSGVVELGVTGTLVDWVELTCEDQSGTAFVTERTHVPSSFFEVGMTTVTYTCTDTSGNSQLCPFVVTVITEDTTDPTCVNLPTGVVELVELGVPGAIVNWQEPTCDDLSGTATVTMRSNAPFSFFSVGMTVVTYTCTDQAMNSGMCSFTVTVTAVDRTAPMCENVPMGPVGQVEVGMAAGTQVSWQEPTCNDISQTATVTDRTFPPGSFFTVGQTEVIYTCTDASGNSEMCVFSVTVFEVDTTPPECTNLPNDIRQIVELGTAGTEVSWIEPTCFDLSGTGRISMQSATSPFFFSVGMMLVTYTCTDASSNQNTCSFTVTIETIDTVAPIISLCPVEQTIQVELGVTSAVAFWVEPTATDFSGTATLLSRSIGPGESVPLGTTIVNYIFTDASSNTATCTFSITVSPVDTTPPVVVCTEDVPFEVELGTTGTIAVWTEPTATDISGVTSLTERSHSPGSFFSVGKTTVTYVFSDNTGNSATCIFCVCITTVDTTPPTCANVPQGVLEVVELGVTGTLVDWVELTCEDQSGTAFVTERTHIPSSFFEVGMTTVTYTCTDTSGNSQLCPFVVTVITEDTTDPTCVNLPTGVVEFVELGVPGAIVNWQEPTCDDLSGTATVTMRSNAPFSFFSVGMTVVTYTCTDRAMNSGMCSFTVTVTAVDRTAPMCENVPMGLVGQVEVGMAVGTLVSWEEPTCNDVSQTAIVSNRTFLPGSFFLVGQTEVIYTCTDGSGNNEMCVFIVTVVEVDNTPPVIDCPEDVSLVVEIGTGGATATWIDPVATDLSGMATVSCDFVQGMFFPTGETTVTCIARDNSNNVASCTFIVIIAEVDSIPPIVTCPPDTSRVIEVNSGPVPVFFQRPTATDNSMVTPTVVSQSHSSGDLFDVGKTTVVFLYADLAGNQNQCSFCIEVLEQDTMSPLISACPRNLEQETTLELNTCFVSWTEPTVSDNSGSVSLIEQSHQPFSQFEAGVTTVTYTYADSANNQAMCSFTVTCNPVDMISPFVSCPGNVLETIPLESSFCFATWQDPQASDNSGTVFLNSQTHQRLTSPFPVGETAVTYTYGDPSNNIGMCSFTVTCEQVDGEPPVLVCPQDVTAVVIEGLQGTMVFLNQPTATDNSGQAPFVSLNRESNSFFPVGTTLVVVTATDASGNGATCSFNVIVIEGNPCDPNPCSNGGVCVIDSLTMFTCVCPDCFEGRICEISLDACSNNPCQNGAACRAVDGSCDVFTCECPPCFSGEFCQDFRDACENHQCRNGAECCPDVNCLTYSCQCPTCFNGPFCEVAINPCTTNLCQNGAQCLPDFTGDCSGYACICDGCFTGRLCNQPFDICQTNPCQNNGLCTNDNNDCYRFTCQCFGCFTGLTCELAFQNPCLPNPCTNGGQCTVVETSCSSYICNCPKGFIGINCETVQVDNSNPCNSFPCENGATCVASGINYICMCRNGFAGINCADSLVAQPQLQLACRSNPCQANAECINSFHSASNNFVYQPQYSCRCSNQFTGQNCGDFAGVALSFCNPNPCSNGGSCNNAYHSFMSEVDYVCTCPVGFRGQDCESDVGNPCDSSPCQNGGTCTPFNTYFSCSCLSGFSGLFCQLANAGNVPSVFNCPSDITVSTAGTSSQASWQEPISFGGVGTVEQVYNSHNPGDSFPVGETPVTYVFMDSALQFTTCSFFVIIRGAATNSPCDTNNPCPPNEVCIFSEITMTLTCEPFGNPPNFMPAFESRRKRDVSIQILLDDEYGTECPCLNGGRCIILVGNGTFCQCHDGYHGKICEDSNEQLEEVLTGDEEEERQEALFIKVILGSMLIMMVLSLIMLTIKIIKRKQEVKTDEKPVIT